MNIIEFKGELPFIQKFELDGAKFEMSFYHRGFDDTVMCDLLNESGEFLSKNNSLRLGQPLFSHMIPDFSGKIRLDFPQKLLVPLSESDSDLRLGKDNFLKDILITVQEIGWYIPNTDLTL